MVFLHGSKLNPLEQQELTTFYRSDFRNAFAPFTPDMTPVVVARFSETPDPKQLRVERLPRNEIEVRKAVSIAAFLALAEIFDPTIPCVGGASRDLAYPLLETEGLELLRKYSSVKAETVAEAVDYLLANSHKQTVAAKTTRRTMAYLDSRRNDGMNARGDLSQDGICYSDYTLYQAVNPPQSVVGHSTVSPYQSSFSFFFPPDEILTCKNDYSFIHSAQRSRALTSIKTC
jgi:hypothetical protein